ncbi:hypothetical protein GCM10010840_35820 [Deinococcus aerolatus]|uniref:3-hydroxyacyl-CoA dehydrogenase NAD binding domain-containing protein n=1 Tax=Deinococcus aerolatus TaxID=522487 RepID=A0ABQ2GHC5_9DEIO|nr:3-hydroxyacyl-CoA dehydrogenase NAD-binding domain-containing protein [Deinococcus aerolatus]GGL94628.1 hypothetical protein GCM10010840_35820 [Deinococcus aerolatus]
MLPITLALLAAAVLGATVWNVTRRPRASAIQAPSPASTTTPSLHPDSPFKETHMTHLTVIGAGNMGRGIAHVAARGGNTITIIDRNPSDAQTLAAEVQAASPTSRSRPPRLISR